ncbi:MAG TPA: hypothetical protein VFI65_24620 [Streptosporangiaceae bacterium]|nr:hypothetical protein [Streptosporangiaceae bacterium]
MTNGTPRTRFADYLPEVFRTGGAALSGTEAGAQAAAFLAQFLGPFETVYDELQGEIEGTPAPQGAVQGASPVAGGIPDLFAPGLTPPSQFTSSGTDTYAFLRYLADWIGIALRPERPVDWNRQFLAEALELNLLRGTLTGLDALLRAWLKGDLLETSPPMLVLTDLTRTDNDADSAFQLDVTATVGVQTVLGEGPPFWFVVDLVADPAVRELRNPIGLDVLQRAARSLLAAEKPAHSYYQLRVRATTMQLAPANSADRRPGEIYAQLEDVAGAPPLLGTALLWDEPWVFDSDPGSAAG